MSPIGSSRPTARSFILADTPGHERYTRNMFTGASTADVAVVLVDARSGVLTQTRRHAHISALLGIRHMVVCVNKMDLVDWDPRRCAEVEQQVHELTRRLGVPDLLVIPISALRGDNVAARSEQARRSMTAQRCSNTSRTSTPRPTATSSACVSRSNGWGVRRTAAPGSTRAGWSQAR